MLRIHVDSAAGTASIPADNPFVNSGSSITQKIWAYGLRNPFRDSFDRLNGQMFIGDVGQDTREEIDVQQATNPGGGENYGWRVREGSIQNPAYPSASTPTPAVDPIYDYPHTIGQTVIGGYVYRGKQIPALQGTYVFADYLGPEPSPTPPNPNTGRIFSLNYNGASASNVQDLTPELFPTSVGGFPLQNPSSLGEDSNGELYITDIGNGSVYKIVPVTPNVTIDSIAPDPQSGGHIIAHVSGVPFKNHTIQGTSTLLQPFAPITTMKAAGDGTFTFDATSLGKNFYRVVYP